MKGNQEIGKKSRNEKKKTRNEKRNLEIRKEI